MDASSVNLIYDKSYYDDYGHNHQPYQINYMVRAVLNKLTVELIRKVHPKTHLDIGCAMGFMVTAMRSAGVESYGIDASEYAILNADVAARRFVRQQMIQGIDTERRFDLVTCVEVVEHIPPEEEDAVLDILCGLSDHVYFSSAEDYDSETHINVHPLSYWRGQFLERGFICDNEYHPALPWGRLFVKATSYDQLKHLLDSETRGIVLQRDNFTCVLCGKKGVQVHEIIPRSAFGKRSMQMCYEERNRVCLCPECHAYAHTVEMRKKLFALMSEKYGYQYPEQEFAKYIGE